MENNTHEKNTNIEENTSSQEEDMQKTAPSTESKADATNDFSQEYKAFLAHKKKLAEKKEKRRQNRWKKWMVLLVLLAFVAGIVVDGNYHIYDRTIDAFNVLGGKQNNDPSFAITPEPKPPVVIDSPVSPVINIAKAVLPSVVSIQSTSEYISFWGNRTQQQGTGSGFIIDKDGLIVTNEHVIHNANDIKVLYGDKTLDAELIGSDTLSDLAVLKVKGQDYPPVTIGDSSSLEVGELVVPMGSPVGPGFAGSVTSGIVSGLNRQVYLGDKTMNLIQTDAAINPGNSGGPLVNAAGQVVGINVLKFADASVEGMSFSIPINEARPIIEELINKGQVVRPGIGIKGRDVKAEEVDEFNVPQGVVIAEIMPDSSAETAGLEVGDIITHFDNKVISGMEELIKLIQERQVGDKVNIQVFRNNKILDFEISLKQR